jgi:hypothetical protein
MQSNRVEELNRLSETAVNGRILHKIDLIGMVRICGVHYFNVYRRYNNVHEIVIEDSNGDFYLQRDKTLRESIGKVLCLSESQQNSMYTAEVYSFRHGGDVPYYSSAPENMYWSEIHREWCAIEINLRGVFEEYFAFMSQRQPPSEGGNDESDSEEDMESHDEASSGTDESHTSEETNETEEEEEDEEDDSDMPPLISDDEEETPPRNTIVYPPPAPRKIPEYMVHVCLHPDTRRDLCEAFKSVCQQSCNKRTFSTYEDSEEEVTVKEESESECESEQSEEDLPRRGSGPDDYIILRNGTKYRKIN